MDEERAAANSRRAARVVDDVSHVLPSRDDDVVARSAEAVGGVAGERVRSGGGWWTALRASLVLGTFSLLAGYGFRAPCHGDAAIDFSVQYSRLCYSDVPHLFVARGFADGLLPYLQTRPDVDQLEYPVLTGAFMQIATWITGTAASLEQRRQHFFDVNVLLLAGCLLAVVICTALTSRRRPWDAAMVALAPGVILTSFINWDLLAVALTAGFMLAWARNRSPAAGILLGLAVAAKFYPVLLLGPLFLICRRAGRLDEFWRVARISGLTWIVLNITVMIVNFEGWKRFYTFSAERGEDFGSPWYMATLLGHPLPTNGNLLPVAVLAALCLGIAALSVVAPVSPRFAQLAFLTVAAFCMTNKVYSPQYVLWLIPLAVLARPRWRDFLIWQATEVVYFVAIWLYLEGLQPDGKGLPERWYAAAIAVRLAGTAYFSFMIARDVLRSEHDPLVSERVADEPAALLDPPPGRRHAAAAG